MFPQAKATNEVVVTQLGDELVIYDRQNHKGHAMNQTATFVWQHCDGKTTPKEMARLMAQELNVNHAEQLTWLALDHLEKAGLLQDLAIGPENRHGILSRREVLKMAGVSLAMLPLITSITAPTAAMAQSNPTGEEEGENGEEEGESA